MIASFSSITANSLLRLQPLAVDRLPEAVGWFFGRKYHYALHHRNTQSKKQMYIVILELERFKRKTMIFTNSLQ